MVRCKLERFGEGKIYPHEETLSGPKQDRLLLTRACRANLSQIFGLFPDEANAAQNLLEAAAKKVTPVEATDHLGVVHRLWTITDPAVISKLVELMAPKPLFIADGHHRYETACNYRDELAAAGKLTPDHPANFVLMMCVGMSDPGLLVLPTHRLFRGLPAMDSKQLVAKLGDSLHHSPGRRRGRLGHHHLGRNRIRRRPRDHRFLHRPGRTLDHRQSHTGGHEADGRDRQGAFLRLARTGRFAVAPAGYRNAARRERPAQAEIRPFGRTK